MNEWMNEGHVINPGECYMYTWRLCTLQILDVIYRDLSPAGVLYCVIYDHCCLIDFLSGSFVHWCTWSVKIPYYFNTPITIISYCYCQLLSNLPLCLSICWIYLLYMFKKRFMDLRTWNKFRELSYCSCCI